LILIAWMHNFLCCLLVFVFEDDHPHFMFFHSLQITVSETRFFDLHSVEKQLSFAFTDNKVLLTS